MSETRPTTTSAGQSATEWEAKGLCNWCCEKPAVTAEGECKECSRLPGHSHEYEDGRDDEIATLRQQLAAEKQARVSAEATLDDGSLFLFDGDDKFLVEWHTPATPPQTDTPAVEGATNEALMAGIGATHRLLQKNLKLAQLNYDLQRLIDRAIDVMYDTMGKDDLMDYADFIDTLRKAGKGGGE